MKRTLFILLALFLAPSIYADDPSTPDFSQYPQTPNYKDAFCGKLFDSNILEITAFAGTDRFLLEYMVSEKGKEIDVRDVPNFAAEASHRKQLSDDQMKALLTAIGELPSKNVYGPAGYLVIVRTHQGATTITRCYDGKDLPKAVRDIYTIIGERFETAGIK